MKHAKHDAEPKPDLPPLSPEIDPLDQDAFERAIAMMRQRDPMHAAQIDGKLAHEGFAAAGRFAAYAMQCDTLRLRPWECPPCDAKGDAVDPAIVGYGYGRAEISLRNRLQGAGLSIYEPDPLAALTRCGAA
jgi:hypothetical protein